MNSFTHADLIDTLKLIDAEAALETGNRTQKHSVVIVGSSALMLSELASHRVTHDIDVLEADERISEILDRYSMVNRQVAAHVDSIPYGFEDRLVRVDIDTVAVDFYTPSLEDLAVMKLYAWRPNNVQDLKSDLVLSKMDWELLDRLVTSKTEAKASCLSPRRYAEMVGTYHKFLKEIGRE